MMEESVVTVKGQVVIPSRIKKKFGIKKGTPINFYDNEGEIKLIPLTPDLIDKNAGILNTKGKLLKALIKEKRKESNAFAVSLSKQKKAVLVTGDEKFKQIEKKIKIYWI